MIKELKYLFFIIVIFLFIFIILQYYFSDNNKKKSYRSLKNIDEKIINFSQKVDLLASNTDDVAEYIEKTEDKKKNDYNFWKLINDN